MGMFDDVLLKNVKCQHCKKKIKEFSCQTKDFGCTLDYFKQDDDVRELTQSWWLKDGSLGRGKDVLKRSMKNRKDKKLPKHIRDLFKKDTEESTRELSRKEIKEKYGDRSKYNIHFWKSHGHSFWSVYKYYGLHNRNWSDVESTTFNCYGSCPKCKTWNEFDATIRNHLFIGVEE